MIDNIGITIIEKARFSGLGEIFRNIYCDLELKIHLFWSLFQLSVIRFIDNKDANVESAYIKSSCTKVI